MMLEKKRRNERLVAILFLGIISLNYPLLSLFSKNSLFLGIPILYLYIFSIWAILIICIAFILEKPAFPMVKTSTPRSEKPD